MSEGLRQLQPGEEVDVVASVALDAEAAFLRVCKAPRGPAWRQITQETLVAAIAVIAEDDDVPFVTLRTVDGAEVAVSADSLAEELGVGPLWRAWTDGTYQPALDERIVERMVLAAPATPAPAPDADGDPFGPVDLTHEQPDPINRGDIPARLSAPDADGAAGVPPQSGEVAEALAGLIQAIGEPFSMAAARRRILDLFAAQARAAGALHRERDEARREAEARDASHAELADEAMTLRARLAEAEGRAAAAVDTVVDLFGQFAGREPDHDWPLRDNALSALEDSAAFLVNAGLLEKHPERDWYRWRTAAATSEEVR